MAAMHESPHAFSVVHTRQHDGARSDRGTRRCAHAAAAWARHRCRSNASTMRAPRSSRRSGPPLIVDRVVQQRGDRLVLATAVLEHQGHRASKVRTVDHIALRARLRRVRARRIPQRLVEAARQRTPVAPDDSRASSSSRTRSHEFAEPRRHPSSNAVRAATRLPRAAHT